MYSMQTTAPVDQPLVACVANLPSGDAGVQQVLITITQGFHVARI